MKFAETGHGRMKPFALLVVCVAMLAIAIFLLAPRLGQTIFLVRQYEARPDVWVYYVILAGCALVLGASLFLLFHGYGKGNDDEHRPD
ncbi:MAG: hypothetical protein A2V52_00345 [Actinobacteria bacterium RBG_19FT_COMBO_54_7]|uniref:Uncharacterized protein n=1 Tax=Candidatus Solincola sediminis TaxID=1797199 RepID=A0A1F2WRI7_9ACTN|nr:MAG: hypothetical protein A2Y75_11315 [Candidatus Solincola sediminis]OFW60216.1 MAG: hypothetical protein A2W01_08745 [Candidatus Solincola sediminis]OFW66946.1 MAG: hypothetical protein A2V52_00345 [Actinobacteria bacterium RBG_19FT_COMBO_54_7]